MWHACIETLDQRVQKFALLVDQAPLPYGDVLKLWRTDSEFRQFFIDLLRDAPFSAFRWETPPLTAGNVNRGFEFVLLNSDALERPVDREAFASHFAQQADIVTFDNLGGDATLVVPCPVAEEAHYGHLASFVREAPAEQVHHLWQAVGEAMQQRLGAQPVWLSTAGMGVAWLHVRLDSRPKYYGYEPFRRRV